MNDHDLLLQALGLATIRRGFCAPNPAVGALLVKDSAVIASGYHQAAGEPHAEVVALQQASLTTSATLYVTLEPCCHHGKTPPCTDQIIAAGVSRVVYGFQDPNPEVAGKGAQQLIEAGIQVDHLPMAEIDEFYQSYCYWRQHQRPWITTKLAISIDNKIAGENQQPMQLTGKQCQQFTHQQRLQHDAILTTAQTIIADNPQMNVRLSNKPIKKPVFVLDSRCRFPLDAQLINTASRITLFYQQANFPDIQALKDAGIDCIAISEQHGKLDLDQVVAHIGQAGIHDLWVEAGASLTAACIEQGFANHSYFYLATTWLGQQATPGIQQLIRKAQHQQWKIMGDDVICSMRW